MSLSYTVNLSIALMIIVLAGFIAIPAVRRLICNIHLTREGSVAPGRYLGSKKVAFFVDEKKQITFYTWGKAPTAGKKFEVLYDPQRPEQAAIRNSWLWFEPVDKLSLAIGLLAGAIGLILHMNYVVAICLFVACTVLFWFLVRVILILLVILSLKYIVFSSLGRHILADFPLRTAKERSAKNDQPTPSSKERMNR